MPTLALSLMPVQFRSLCHGLHTLGPPHSFLPLAVPTQLCAKRCKIWIRGPTRVECGVRGLLHRAGGNQVSKTMRQNNAYPLHKFICQKEPTGLKKGEHEFNLVPIVPDKALRGPEKGQSAPKSRVRPH